MSLIAIILIILGGIVLLLVEFLIVPGVSVFGIGGFLCLIGGVIASYVFHGNTAGHITLAAAIAASVASMVFAFRRRTWEKMGLKTSIDGKIVTVDPEKIKSGDTGIAITRLAPMGKVKVHDLVCEAKSISGFIDENTEIEVLKVSQNQLIVKLKT